MKYAILSALCLASICKADHQDLVHFAAHAGASYAINTIAYGMCTRWNIIKPWDGDYSPEVKCDPSDKACLPQPASNRIACMMLAGFTTAMVGFLYKHIECHGIVCDPAQVTRSMFYNAAGIGLSIGSIVLFNF